MITTGYAYHGFKPKMVHYRLATNLNREMTLLCVYQMRASPALLSGSYERLHQFPTVKLTTCKPPSSNPVFHRALPRWSSSTTTWSARQLKKP